MRAGCASRSGRPPARRCPHRAGRRRPDGVAPGTTAMPPSAPRAHGVRRAPAARLHRPLGTVLLREPEHGVPGVRMARRWQSRSCTARRGLPPRAPPTPSSTSFHEVRELVPPSIRSGRSARSSSRRFGQTEAERADARPRRHDSPSARRDRERATDLAPAGRRAGPRSPAWLTHACFANRLRLVASARRASRYDRLYGHRRVPDDLL